MQTILSEKDQPGKSLGESEKTVGEAGLRFKVLIEEKLLNSTAISMKVYDSYGGKHPMP